MKIYDNYLCLPTQLKQTKYQIKKALNAIYCLRVMYFVSLLTFFVP